MTVSDQGNPPAGTYVAGTALARLRAALHLETQKVVVGQGHIVDGVLAALSVGGHLLLEGAPGVAKSLLASTVAKSCSMSSRRIQFTPDMLPSDVTGTLTLRSGELVFRPGPVFTNVLLADEINRTPPKTQAALLEAMQEGQVSVDGTPHVLPSPFIVLATQNPIEYEGTYPLPEAQLDRFCMKLEVGYPQQHDEIALLSMRRSGVRPATLDDVAAVATSADVLSAQVEVDAVVASDAIVNYVGAIVRRTRELPSVLLGASPRAGVHLLALSKAAAALNGRSYVVPDDVVSLVIPVLRHRLILTPEAEIDRFRSEDALRTVLSSVPVPR
jgi:MoxR-like ATPase